MTSRRDLGPILAVGGLVLVVAAVIGGFLAVGGPGDARAQRLDDQTLDKLISLAHTAQCAYNAAGHTFPTPDEMYAEAEKTARAGAQPECMQISPLPTVPKPVGSDGDPATPGEIDYVVIDDSHIRLCGNFRQPFDPQGDRPSYPAMERHVTYPEFQAPRPKSGPHCYEIELVRPSSPPA